MQCATLITLVTLKGWDKKMKKTYIVIYTRLSYLNCHKSMNVLVFNIINSVVNNKKNKTEDWGNTLSYKMDDKF